MKPKTALQRQVVKLSAKLPAITKNQTAWAIKNCFEVEGFPIYHTPCWASIVLVAVSISEYWGVVKGYIHLNQCISRL